MTIRQLTTLTFVLVAVALAAACGEPPPPPVVVAPEPEHFNGHWEGAAHIAAPIANAPEQLDIVAIISDENAAECGMIEYSHAGCSGRWHCAQNDGTVLHINETIRYNADRCPSGATIELTTTTDPDILEFRYSHAAVGIQAAGQLNRRAIQ